MGKLLYSIGKFVAAAALALVLSWPTSAQVDLDELLFVEVFRGLSNTTSITHAGDGSGRLFVTEQVG
ncbi:MAG: hypothetical protein OXB91_05080, partial [Bryobacterales bacterium]|nr:hypothetical protein [Bryobacterales bacterium]